MSYLGKPRIGFFGSDAMTNPSTANNENVMHLLDYDNVRLINPPAAEGSDLPTMSDAAYREWMTTLITYSDPLDQIPDSTQPNWRPTMPGYWNYWGDHLTTFGGATITSTWLDDDPLTAPGSDALLGANIVFNARIVDLNPADTYCSQFVAAGFSVVGSDLEGNRAELLRGVPTTSMTRWLNFYRYYGAGTFQAVIPNSSLSFIDDAGAPDSRGLRALRDGARHGGGLLLRWCFYGMKAARSMLEMYDAFQQGEAALNPKIGRVVGSIGVWNGTDMVSTPVGRIFQQPGPPYFPASGELEAQAKRRHFPVKTHEDVERVVTTGNLLNATSAELDCAKKMGPAAAVVLGNRVVLDLNTAFPEITCDPDATGDPFQKHDFGTVNLELVYGSGSPVVLGSVQYDAETYQQLGGVWEVPFDPASETGQHIADGFFQLRDEAGNVLLQEIDVVNIITDDQAVYLDMDQTSDGVKAAGTAALRVFIKGEPISEPITISVERWNDVQIPGRANSVNPLVVTATEIVEQRSDAFSWEIPAGGQAEVPIEAERPACYKLRYIPPGMDVDPSEPAWAVEYFSCFRVLPYDDYSHVPDAELTFEFVYDEVFSYYSILYPVMANIIPWGPANTPRDPERVEQFASLILQAIDESRLGTALEMPITRELSAGKRALLQRWCSLQLPG